MQKDVTLARFRLEAVKGTTVFQFGWKKLEEASSHRAIFGWLLPLWTHAWFGLNGSQIGLIGV